MEMKELAEINRKLIKGFEKQENKKWTVETCVMELAAECGQVADVIMKYEKYKQGASGLEDIKDELSDVLFMLFRIADEYKIDFEKAYLEMAKRTEKKLNLNL